MPRRSTTGFILLAILMILALSALVLAGMVRRSCSLMLQANARAEQLQVQWGTLSLQYTLLARADKIIGQAAADSHQPTSWHRCQVELGSITYSLLLGDEQAKANINILHLRQDTQTLQETLLQLLPLANEGAFLLPEAGTLVNVECIDQLFHVDDPAALVGPTEGDPMVAGITCWGSGLLNYHRCSPGVLGQVAQGILTPDQQARLLELRQRQEDIKLPQLLPKLQLSDSQLSGAEALLTDDSKCHSLWIVAKTAHRNWVSLAVRNEPSGRVSSFAW